MKSGFCLLQQQGNFLFPTTSGPVLDAARLYLYVGKATTGVNMTTHIHLETV